MNRYIKIIFVVLGWLSLFFVMCVMMVPFAWPFYDPIKGVFTQDPLFVLGLVLVAYTPVAYLVMPIIGMLVTATIEVFDDGLHTLRA